MLTENLFVGLARRKQRILTNVSWLKIQPGNVILKDSISKLLGEVPDEKLVEQIKTIAGNETEHDMQIHHIHLHSYGEHQEITFHIRLPNTMSVEDSHALVTTIRQSLRETLSIEATIHVEPSGKR